MDDELKELCGRLNDLKAIIEEKTSELEEKRLRYIGCLEGKVPTELYQIVASFLSVKERCIYSCCSRFYHDEVVFGGNSNVFVWKHSTSKDLWLASSDGSRPDVVERILSTCGDSIDIDWRNPDDNFDSTALITASKIGHVSIVPMLLEGGANVDVQDSIGRTALMYASQKGHESIISMLLEANSSVDLQDEIGLTALILAGCNGHEAAVSRLLDTDATIDLQSRHGETALLWTSRNGHEPVVLMLLQAGASIDVHSMSGDTALTWARKKRHEAVALILEEAQSVHV